MESVFPLLPFLFIVIYLALIGLAFWLLYTLIRLAVRRALREHQLWLDARGGR